MVHAKIETAFAHYAKLGKMQVRTWVAMPDHLHFVARFNKHAGMARTVCGLKHYLAAQADVRWQRGFFDHRLRSATEMKAKCAYVRMNPVRAGLARTAEEWPYRGG